MLGHYDAAEARSQRVFELVYSRLTSLTADLAVQPDSLEPDALPVQPLADKRQHHTAKNSRKHSNCQVQQRIWTGGIFENSRLAHDLYIA